MMGQISGSTDAVAEFRAFIEGLKDPKKLAAQLEELEKLSADIKQGLAEKAQAEGQIEKKLKELAQADADSKKRAKELDAREKEIEKYEFQTKKLLDEKLKAESRVDAKLSQLEQDSAKFDSYVQQSNSDLLARDAALRKEKAQVQELKTQLEAKMAKLKQAMG